MGSAAIIKCYLVILIFYQSVPPISILKINSEIKMTITISPEHGYVILAASGAFLLNLWQMMKISGKRKELGITRRKSYPAQNGGSDCAGVAPRKCVGEKFKWTSNNTDAKTWLVAPAQNHVDYLKVTATMMMNVK